MKWQFFRGFFMGCIFTVVVFEISQIFSSFDLSTKQKNVQQSNVESSAIQSRQHADNFSKDIFCNCAMAEHYVANDHTKNNEAHVEEVTLNDIVFIVITGVKRLHHAHIAARTWVRHIPPSNLFFYSDHNCSNLPNCRNVGAAEERRWIKTKVVSAFTEIYQQYSHKKWFMKLDDDTFLVTDHLLKLLSHYNSSHLHYVGRYYDNWGDQYCEGGAGYLFSHGLMKEMMTSGKYRDCMMTMCFYPYEDVCTGKCMKMLYDLDCDLTTTGFHQELPRDAKQYAVENFYGNAITFHPTRSLETAIVLDLIYYRQEWHKREDNITHYL
jgi:hypothetical protein